VKKQTIILLGGSNSVKQNGLQKGIKDAVDSLNANSAGGGAFLEFYNLALGATTSIQNLYELKRERNREILKNAALIITESNINDEELEEDTAFRFAPTEIVYRNINWLYQELYALNKKIVSIILPYSNGRYKVIDNIHRKLCSQYGFNCIDMQEYYEKHNLMEFANRTECGVHPLERIMYDLGRNIINTLEMFKSHKKGIKKDNPTFKILGFKDLELDGEELEINHLNNSMYDETTCKLTNQVKLKIPNAFKGYIPIAMHTWNNDGQNIKPEGLEAMINYSSLLLKNKTTTLSKESNFLNVVAELNYSNAFVIDENTFIAYNKDNNAEHKEYYVIARSWRRDSIKADHCDFIAIFLAKDHKSFYAEVDFEAFSNAKIPILYDFSALIPPVESYKAVIDEYCAIVDPMKFHHYNAQLNQAQQYIITSGVQSFKDTTLLPASSLRAGSMKISLRPRLVLSND